MGYKHLNYQRFSEYNGFLPGFFEKKFKRKTRVWTIDEVHELYLKVLERHRIRQQLVIDCVDRIVDEVHEFERDKRKVYFKKDGKVYQRELNKSYEFNSWGICSPDLIKFNSDKTIQNRNEKLEFLLSNEKAFELGELYESLQGNTKHYHLGLKQILSEMIQDKLRSIYKDSESPRILTVFIGDRKYYVECEERYRHSKSYKKFNLLNEVDTDIKL